MKKLLFVTLLLIWNVIVNAQVKVTGTVYSKQDREILIGATVVEAETTNGSVTDLNGKFSINCSRLPVTLKVDYMGMDSKLVLVKSKTEIPLKIYLEETANEIDEVVVIGYGTVRKSDLTGSVSSMKGSDIGNSHMLSLEQAMAGKMAGVNIVNTSGEPGAGISITIRGTGSINSDSEPLYVIDGAPMSKDIGSEVGNPNGLSSSVFNPLSSLNPNDIQSIEVLKDASATAIYGSRGANGVVLITTKSGMEGKPVVSFSTYVGVGNVSKKIDMLQGAEYLDYMAHERQDEAYIQKYDSLQSTPFYDWQDYLFKSSITQEYNIGVRGGGKTTRYSMSAAYTDQSGLVDNSGFDRFTLRSRIDQNIGTKAKMGVNINFSKTSQDGVPSGGSKDTGADVFQQVLSYRPANVRFNDKDILDSGDLTDDYNLQTNPYDYVTTVQNRLNTVRTNANLYLQYDIIKGLQFKTYYNVDMVNTNKEIFFGPNIAAGASKHGIGVNSWAKRYNWSWENILTYNKVYKKDHSFNAMVGYTMERNNGRNFSIETWDYPDAYVDLIGGNVGLGLNIQAPSVKEYTTSLVSYLGRVNYAYKSKYLFTASVRADGSSKFPKGNKFSYFPSAAVAWNVHREDFMKSLKNLDELKLRFSYGRTGNQGIAAYSSLSTYANVYYSFNTVSGIRPASGLKPGIATSSIANPDLTWETTEQFNAGFDVSLFKRRLSLSVDAYYKKTFDLLLAKPLEYTTGFSTMMYNSGSLENKGIEFVLNSINVSNKDFSWTSSLNMSFNRNKVLNLGENSALTFNANNVYSEAFILKPGQPVGTMYGFIYDGVYQYKDYKNFYKNNDPAQGLLSLEQCQEIYDRAKNGEETLVLMDGQPKYANDVPLPGSAKFRDVVGDDNNITTDDRTYIGNSEPKFTGGFTNKFNYKGFDLNIFLSFSYGGKLFVTNYFPVSGYNNRNILKQIYDDAWRPYRDSNKWPDYTIDSYKNLSSSLFVEDGSYLKIKDVTLGYTLPSAWLKKANINKVRIYVTGQNLFTFTKFNWYDPEVTSNNPITAGKYHFVYPSSRTFITGLSIDF